MLYYIAIAVYYIGILATFGFLCVELRYRQDIEMVAYLLVISVFWMLTIPVYYVLDRAYKRHYRSN